jgi:hypothetical protein
MEYGNVKSGDCETSVAGPSPMPEQRVRKRVVALIATSK